jgi:hypothetical protein
MAEVNFLVKKGLTVPKGSASTPSVIFDASDPNTGLYSPGADQVAVATNGTGRLFVDSSGRVGVGTGGSAIQSTLHVSKNGAEGFEFIPGDSANTNVVIHYNLYKSANSAWSRISTRAGGLLRSGTTWVTNEQWADNVTSLVRKAPNAFASTPQGA